MAAVLHEAWGERRRIVIELGVPLEALRAPEVERRPPYELDPGFTFERERLQFLVWANTYDARKDGEPIWWHGVRASRIGATLGGPADVLLPTGSRLVRRRPPPPGRLQDGDRSRCAWFDGASSWRATGCVRRPGTPIEVATGLAHAPRLRCAATGPVAGRRRRSWRRISWRRWRIPAGRPGSSRRRGRGRPGC